MNPPSISPIKNYINGQWHTPTQTLTHWNHNPNDNQPFHQHTATDPANLETALASAWHVHQSGTWANTPPAQRADLLDQVADYLAPRIPHIAAVESYTTGMVITLTEMVCQIVHLAFRSAAQQARSGWLMTTLPGQHAPVEVWRKPWGPAVCIVPWNAPSALSAHKIANALAAGCPTLLKPSEWAPYACQFLAEAIEAVGLPPGVFQLVNGGAAVGAQLVSDPRVRAVSFTGGLRGGRAIAQACATTFKPAQLELGGNNAMVVLEDANLDAAAEGIAAGMTTLNGQWCRALGRLIVHERIHDDLLERALDQLSRIKIGHSLDRASQMGPLVHAGHYQLVQSAVTALQAKGGQAHQVTGLPAGQGHYFPPTLITGIDPAGTTTEIFGPVATIHPFRTEAQALTLANQTPYGLGGYVYSQDEDRALTFARQMTTGGIKINGVSLMSLNHMAPRPAWGLSGYGEEGTQETFRFFCGTRIVGIANR